MLIARNIQPFGASGHFDRGSGAVDPRPRSGCLAALAGDWGSHDLTPRNRRV